MQVELAVKLCKTDGAPPATCVTSTGPAKLAFRCPKALTEAGFPTKEAAFEFDRVYRPEDGAGKLYEDLLTTVPNVFLKERQNILLYAYGPRSTTKRADVLGVSASPAESLAGLLVQRLFETGLDGAVLQIQAYTLGEKEKVGDLLDPGNPKGHVADLTDVMAVQGTTLTVVTSAAEALEALTTAARNLEAYVSAATKPDTVDLLGDAPPLAKDCECPCGPFDPAHAFLVVRRFDNAAAVESGEESNSLQFVVCGDSERPPLCGFHLNQLVRYNTLHKAHGALISMLSAIRTNRLRVPFNKSTLTLLLKRAHTPLPGAALRARSYVLVFAPEDSASAEEAYHTLYVAKRIVTVTGAAGVGPLSREPESEKWRLMMDINDLKEELLMAKMVHDYKPVIFGQAKPVANIEDEETRRMGLIRKKKEEQRAKAEERLREEAEARARQVLQREEEQHREEADGLQARGQEMARAVAELEAGREKRVKMLRRDLEKSTRKRDDEEQDVLKAQAEVTALEDRLALTDARVRRAAAHAAWLKEQAAATPKALADTKLPTAQRRALVDARRAERAAKLAAPVDGEADTKAVDHSVSESIVEQLAEYKTVVGQNAQKAKQAEQERAAELQTVSAAYKGRVVFHDSRVARDGLLQSLGQGGLTAEQAQQQAVRVLEIGCGMALPPAPGATATRRWFFLSPDHKTLLECATTGDGAPLDRQHATAAAEVQGIKRVLLGQVGSSSPDLAELLDDEKGTMNPIPTPTLTAATVPQWFYRSLALEKTDGAAITLVADNDAEFECWTMALGALLPGRLAWGAPLRLQGRPGADALDKEEAALCAEWHIAPQQYLFSKKDAFPRLKDRRGTEVVDLRRGGTLDFIRAHAACQLWKAKGLI